MQILWSILFFVFQFPQNGITQFEIAMYMQNDGQRFVIQNLSYEEHTIQIGSFSDNPECFNYGVVEKIPPWESLTVNFIFDGNCHSGYQLIYDGDDVANIRIHRNFLPFSSQ